MSKFATHKDLKLDADITVGTEAANAINVAIQLKDRLNKNKLAERAEIGFYISDDANGDSLAATAPDSVAIGTDGLIIETVANKAGRLVCESDGDIDIDIGEDGADTWYLILVMPDGMLVPSGAITFTT